MSIATQSASKLPGFLTSALAAALMAAVPCAAQFTGVSHPSTAPITADAPDVASGETPAPAPAKPSAAIPATAATVYGPYVPYRGANAAQPESAPAVAAAFDPDASIITAATAGRHPLPGPDNSTADSDYDARIVTSVPSLPGEVPEGALVKARLREPLSTLTTRPGTKFTAAVSEPLLRDGQVIIPAGSILEGRVAWVRGGKRIGGAAAIHLEPRTITLPDGAQYVLRARAIDTNSWENTKVDDEGTITRSENKKRNVGVMSLTTGGGLAAGAMIAGPAGALVGAGVGAGVSTVVWLKQDRQAELPKDLQIVFSLTEPMSVTPATAAVAPAKLGQSGGE